MKKKMLSGLFAVLFAFSTVTGISAASDSVFSEKMQEEFQDEMKEEEEVFEKEDDGENSEEDPDASEETVEADFEQDSVTDQDLPEFEADLPEFEADLPEFQEDALPESEEEEISQQENLFTSEEADIFTDGAAEEVGTSVRSTAVKAVASNYRMRPEYAFAYAFRKGATKLTEVQGASAGLPAKLDAQFGWSKNGATNYKNTFSACSIQNTAQKGRISVKYTNVGEYQGKIVDLRITVPEWGAVSYTHIGVDNTVISPCILFYNDRIAFSTLSVGTVRFKFEFFDHATGNQIYPKGHVTMMDLDGGQGFRVYDGWGVDAMYIRSGYDHLKASTGTTSNGTVYTEVRAPEGVSTDNDDVKGWCHVDFNGSFTVNWLAGEGGLKGISPYAAFFMSGAQTVGTYEPNDAPEKKAGDTNASYGNMKYHASESDSAAEKPYDIPRGREFDYVVAQTVLPGDYRRFEITDKLDSCLEYKSASVRTALGNDVTQQFAVSNTQNTVKFAAAGSFLKTDAACNNVTYYFRIHVKVKADSVIAGHGHYKDGMYYHISNQAERRLESSQMADIKKTNVSWIRGVIETNCSIRKTDAEDSKKNLSDAIFEAYEWNEQEQRYVSAGQKFLYTGETKLYTKKLQYTARNKGRFRLIETRAPEGYLGGWKRDISILDMNPNFVLEVQNTAVRLPCGEVTVTKKIRERDIIWAHGNPIFRFTIKGKDQRGLFHAYENYVEFKKENYKRQGDYAVLSCTVSGIPIGNYTISEKETLRYKFQGITADTSNVQINGREGTASLDRENKTAAVTFTNIKTRYDGYSHTDVIKNKIPVKK